jgi:hypothetical protein
MRAPAAAIASGLVAAAVAAACSGKRVEGERAAVGSAPAGAAPAAAAPAVAVAPTAPGRLCVTKGAAAVGGTVTEPTVRAVALGSSGDAASLAFVFRGETAASRELASGESRRQLGLKLRAQDGCNLLYVMWRLEPRPSLLVSIKRNPGLRTNKECGTRGYTRIKPERGPALAAAPDLAPGASHTLRAEIEGDELRAWIDDQLAWRGPLPPAARELAGPAGLRSDNVSFDLVAFDAAAASAGSAAGSGAAPAAPAGSAGPPRCLADGGDD